MTTQTQLGELTLDGQRYVLAPDRQGYLFRTEKAPPFAPVAAPTTYAGLESFQTYRPISINDLALGLGLFRIPSQDHRDPDAYRRVWKSEGIDTRWSTGIVLSPALVRQTMPTLPNGRLVDLLGNLYLIYRDPSRNYVTLKRRLLPNRTWSSSSSEAESPITIALSTPAVATDGQTVITAHYASQSTTRKIIVTARTPSQFQDSHATFSSAIFNAGKNTNAAVRPHLVSNGGILYLLYSSTGGIKIEKHQSGDKFDDTDMPTIGDDASEIQGVVSMIGTDGKPKIYVATYSALYEVDPDDGVVQVVEAATHSSNNFAFPALHQGALYYGMNVREGSPFRLHRLTNRSGARLIEDVSVPDDSLPPEVDASPIQAIVSIRDMLYVIAGGDCTFVLRGETWHCLGGLQAQISGGYVRDEDLDVSLDIAPTFSGERSSFTFDRTGQNLDVYYTTVAGTNRPTGTVVDEDYVWVLDSGHNAGFAFDVDTKQYRPDQNITFGSEIDNPVGGWSNRTHLFVIDATHRRVFVYWKGTKLRDRDKDFNLDISITFVVGGCGAINYGDYGWVLHGRRATAKMTGYYLVTNPPTRPSRPERFDFDLDYRANPSPGAAILSQDGRWIYICDAGDDNVYVYDASVSPPSLQTDLTFPMNSGNQAPTGGITNESGETLWVLDTSDHKFYAYQTSTDRHIPSRDFELAAAQSSPSGAMRGAVGGTNYVWIFDTGASKAFAYNIDVNPPAYVADGTRDISLSALPSNFMSGGYVVGTRAYLIDGSSRDVYGIDLRPGNTYGSYNSAWNRRLTTQNDNSDGIIEPPGTYFYVPDYDDTVPEHKAFGYRKSDGGYIAARTFSIQSAVQFPAGGAFDSSNMYIMDAVKNEFLAYSLSTRRRDSSRDFDATGIGTSTIYAAFEANGYAYAVIAFGSEGPNALAYDMSGVRHRPTLDFPTNEALYTGCGTFLNSDQDHLYVVDWRDTFIYAYDLDDNGRYVSGMSINLTGGNTKPVGAIASGDDVWIVDYTDKKAYIYSISGRRYIGNRDITMAPNNAYPIGGFGVGGTGYVLDERRNDLFAYDLSTQQQDGSRTLLDFLDRSYGQPVSAFEQNGTLWVVQVLIDPQRPIGQLIDYTTTTAVAYRLSDGVRLPNLDFTFPKRPDQVGSPVVVGNEVLVPRDNPSRVVERYYLYQDATIRAAWDEGDDFWVVNSNDMRAYAFRKADGQRDASLDFALDEKHSNPRGAMVHDHTVWIFDHKDPDSLAFAYDLSTSPPSRYAARDFTLDANLNDDPIDGFSVGNTGYVLDAGLSGVSNDTIWEYDLRPTVPVFLRTDRNLVVASTRAVGAFTDGETVYVAISGGFSVHNMLAYNLSTKAADRAKDFDLPTSSTSGPGYAFGGHVVGGTAWVLYPRERKAYAFSRPRSLHILAAAENDGDLIVCHTYGSMSVFEDIGSRNPLGIRREADGSVELPYMDIGLPGFQKAWYYVRLLISGDIDHSENVIHVDFDAGGGWQTLGTATASRSYFEWPSGGLAAERLRLRFRFERGAEGQSPVLLNVILGVLPEIPTYTYQFTVDVTKTSIESGVHAPSLLRKLRSAADSVSRVPMKYGGQDTVLVDVAAIRNRLRQEVPDAMLADWGEDSGLVEVVAHERV